MRSAPITVEPAADGVDVGEVLLRAHEPLAFATSLLCGDVSARFGVEDDRATLEVGGERFPMTRTRTASGARYEAEDDPQTFVWQKGEEATVEVRGTALPPCRVLDAPVSGRDVLPGAEWAVETVNGAAALDEPSATLEFTAEGNLSGRASCNRYSTAYAVNGPFIAVDPRVAVTQMACPPPVLDQERAVLDVLAEARTWSLEPDGALLVETADGRALTARRAETAPE
jgi:putative lipoprotein